MKREEREREWVECVDGLVCGRGGGKSRESERGRRG